jgi:hypothetical protein
MTALRLYLIAAWTALVGYTGYVIGNDGASGIGAQFFGAMAEGHWQGQFNADFFAFLILSALWTGWRNRWSPLGWVLAVAAVMFGAIYLMGYLLVLLHREKGDLKRVLLGARGDDLPHRRWTD